MKEWCIVRFIRTADSKYTMCGPLSHISEANRVKYGEAYGFPNGNIGCVALFDSADEALAAINSYKVDTNYIIIDVPCPINAFSFKVSSCVDAVETESLDEAYKLVGKNHLMGINSFFDVKAKELVLEYGPKNAIIDIS